MYTGLYNHIRDIFTLMMNYIENMRIFNPKFIGATVSVSGTHCPAAVPHGTYDMKIAIHGYSDPWVSNI